MADFSDDSGGGDDGYQDHSLDWASNIADDWFGIDGSNNSSPVTDSGGADWGNADWSTPVPDWSAVGTSQGGGDTSAVPGFDLGGGGFGGGLPDLGGGGGGGGLPAAEPLPAIPAWLQSAAEYSNVAGPAGTGAAPDVGALAASAPATAITAGAPTPGVSVESPNLGGISASGGLPGAPSGPQDLSAQNLDPTAAQAPSWFNSSILSPPGDSYGAATAAMDPSALGAYASAPVSAGGAGVGAGVSADGMPSSTATPGTNLGPTLENPAGGVVPVTGSTTGAAGAAGAAPARAAPGNDSGWTNTLGIKNPAMTALAAGLMGYNMYQQKQMTDKIGDPAADLKRLAGTAAQQSSGLTEDGRSIATNAVNNVNQTAADVAARTNLTDPASQALLSKGTDLTKYIGTGTLPPEMTAQVQQATQDAKTARINFYAQRGMPTDPAANTSLRQDLERIDRDALVMTSTLADQLAKSGTTIAGAGFGGSQQGTAAVQGSGVLQKGAGDIGTNMVSSGIQATGVQQQIYNSLANLDAAQQQRVQQAIAAFAAAMSPTPRVNLSLT